MARAVITVVTTWVLLATLFACASPLALGRKAYAEGRLREAEQALTEDASESEDARALLERVHADKNALVKLWLSQATQIEQRDPETASRMALRYYRAAQDLLSSGDSPDASIQEKVDRLQRERGKLEKEYEKLYPLQVESTSPTCNSADIEQRAHRLAKLREALNRRDSFVQPLLTVAQHCFVAEDYVRVVALSKLADEIRLPSEELPLIAEARWALAQSRIEPPVTIEEEQPQPLKERPRGSRTKTRRRAPEPTTAPSEPDPGQDALKTARRLFEQGDTHSAFTTLNASVNAELQPESRESIARQQKAWQDDRQKLVDQYLANGEKALRQEDAASARRWYSLILEIEPQHEVAKGRLNKLDTLQKLRDTQE